VMPGVSGGQATRPSSAGEASNGSTPNILQTIRVNSAN
jgi:hypothetical protein